MPRTLQVWYIAGRTDFSIELVRRYGYVVTETIVMIETAIDQLYEGTIAVGTPADDYDLNFKLGSQYTAKDEVRIGAADGIYRTPTLLSLLADLGLSVSGPYQLRFEVKDAANVPIEDAQIALYRAGDFRWALTDANGVALINSEAVTWTTVSVTATGYQFTTTPITVVANATIPITGTAVNIPAPVPNSGKVTGTSIVYDLNGIPVVGAIAYAKMELNPVTVGIYSDLTRQATSIAGGAVYFENLFKGARYQFWIGNSDRFSYLIPSDAVTPHELPSFIGNSIADPCAT